MNNKGCCDGMDNKGCCNGMDKGHGMKNMHKCMSAHKLLMLLPLYTIAVALVFIAIKL